MGYKTLEELVAETRTEKTSHLIALLNPEGMAAMMNAAKPEWSPDEVATIVNAITDEIDRRIPVPMVLVDAIPLVRAALPDGLVTIVHTNHASSNALTRCSHCGRVSSNLPGTMCEMPQPDGYRCRGAFEKDC